MHLTPSSSPPTACHEKTLPEETLWADILDLQTGVTGGTVTSADDVVSGGKNMINSLIQHEDKLYFKVVMTHGISSLCAKNTHACMTCKKQNTENMFLNVSHVCTPAWC